MFVPYLSPSVGPFYPSLIQYNTIQYKLLKAATYYLNARK